MNQKITTDSVVSHARFEWPDGLEFWEGGEINGGSLGLTDITDLQYDVFKHCESHFSDFGVVENSLGKMFVVREIHGKTEVIPVDGWSEVREEFDLEFPIYHVGQFTVPPQNQGQIVATGYAMDSVHGVVIQRVHDTSGNSVKYFAYEGLGDDFAPWNDVPVLGRDFGQCLVSDSDGDEQ